jgi:hypothetical protein
MPNDCVASTCFRDVQDKVRQNEEMLKDYLEFMDGAPCEDLVARLAAYHASHPQAKVEAASWLADRVARARDIGSIVIDGARDADRVAAGVVEALRKYAAARTPVQPPATHTRAMPSRALNQSGQQIGLKVP